jgi:ABC-2 type transport system ATP-binding protein
MTAGWGVDGVTVRRGGQVVLDDVSLAVPAGQVTTVVGGDGAGKTTLLRVLLGSVLPDAGTVRRPARTATGSMPATSGVWGDLSVAENVDLVAGAYGLGLAEGRARAAGLLEAAGSPARRTVWASSCPAGCARSSGSAWRCCTAPICSCWTSRPPASTR